MSVSTPAHLIEAISVSGYKSIAKEQKITLRPLTLLAGANSSGKSSAIQPFLLLKQTLEAAYDPGGLLLDGPNVRLTLARQAITKGQRRFSIRFHRRGGSEVQVVYGRVADGRLDVERTVLKSPADGLNASFTAGGSTGNQGPFKTVRRRCFLDVQFDSEDPLGLGVLPKRVYDPEALENFIRGISHLPGLRGNLDRTFRTTAIGEYFPGTFDNYVASIIASWQTPAGRRRLDAVCADMDLLQLTWKVEATRLDDSRVELQVARTHESRSAKVADLVSIADVGLGVSQALPVVVALHAARPGHHVYLEQPELHLHPSAQWRMAQVLASAVKRGVKVIVETHSSLILRGIQTLVATGTLSNDDVVLHWFTRDGKTGHTQVDAAMLDGNGAFGEWPSDFDNVSLHADQAYLDAVARRHIG